MEETVEHPRWGHGVLIPDRDPDLVCYRFEERGIEIARHQEETLEWFLRRDWTVPPRRYYDEHNSAWRYGIDGVRFVIDTTPLPKGEIVETFDGRTGVVLSGCDIPSPFYWIEFDKPAEEVRAALFVSISEAMEALNLRCREVWDLFGLVEDGTIKRIPYVAFHETILRRSAW